MWRILILLLIIILLIIYLQNTGNDVEGFKDTDVFNQTTPTITMCPSNSITYITIDNQQLCCNGSIVANKCNGTVLCSLTESKGSVKNCSKYYHDLYIQRAKQFCPKSLPKYFDNRKDLAASVRGCSSSVNADASAGSSKSCKIYNTESEDTANADSCYLMKKQEDIKCPTPTSTSSIVSISFSPQDSFNTVQCNFMDKGDIPMPRTCYETEHFTKGLKDFFIKHSDKSQSRIEEEIQDFKNYAKTDLQFCDAAKKYYIDKDRTGIIDCPTQDARRYTGTFRGQANVAQCAFSSNGQNYTCADLDSSLNAYLKTMKIDNNGILTEGIMKGDTIAAAKQNISNHIASLDKKPIYFCKYAKQYYIDKTLPDNKVEK